MGTDKRVEKEEVTQTVEPAKIVVEPETTTTETTTTTEDDE
jgi:hypothetical protein